MKNSSSKVSELSSGKFIEYSPMESIYSLFIGQLKNYPEKEIIIDDFLNTTLSYKQIYNLIRDTENKLIKQGIGRGSRVGINLNRSYKVIASVIAVCKVRAGEKSGKHGRICDYNWVLDIRNQCIDYNTDFYFK